MENKRVAAICCSDLHLSDKAPIARSAEPCWYSVMERQLRELSALKDEHDGCPILCAGDLFDRACPSLQLVHWAMQNLPQMHAVCGNHDLPGHRREDMHRSAYGLLVEAERIIDLEPNKPLAIGLAGKAMVLHGFGCGTPVKPLKRNNRSDLSLHVAVCHEFVWVPGTGYKGASEEQLAKKVRKRMMGYDVAVVGDNHQPFDVKRFGNFNGKVLDYPHIINVGGFFRRKIDEKDHKPSVALLHEDGTVTRRYLDVSEDKWIDADQLATVANGIGFQSFVESLSELGGNAMDFAAAVHRLLEREKVPQEVKNYMLQALEMKKPSK